MEINEEKLKEVGKNKIRYAILFGSYAKNCVWEESDVDTAVKTEKLPQTFKEKIEVEKEIEKLVNKNVEVVLWMNPILDSSLK